MNDKFWLEAPHVLFDSFDIVPKDAMSLNENLNALTRLVVVITIILISIENEHALKFLCISIGVILFLKFSNGCKMGNVNTKVEGYMTVPPTKGPADPSVEQTWISPVFAEEWEVNPALKTEVLEPIVVNDMNTSYNSGLLNTPDPNGVSYPYGQYITQTNLMPMTEREINMVKNKVGAETVFIGGAKSAREYANSEFTRHDIAFRENMIGVYRAKMNRRYAQNVGYTIDPYSTKIM